MVMYLKYGEIRGPKQIHRLPEKNRNGRFGMIAQEAYRAYRPDCSSHLISSFGKFLQQ
jgi:hypothetical protein